MRVIGDEFTVFDAEFAPALTLGRLQALQEVKERNGRGRTLL